MPGAMHVGAQRGPGRKRRSGSGEEQWKERAPGAADSKLPLREREEKKKKAARGAGPHMCSPREPGRPRAWQLRGGGGGLHQGPSLHPVPMGWPWAPSTTHPIGVSPRACEQRPLRGDGAPSPDKNPNRIKGRQWGLRCPASPPPSPPSTQPCPGEPPHPHVCSSTGCHTNPPPRNPSKVAAKSGEGREEKSIFLVFALCSLGAGGRRAKRDLDFKCCRGANRRAWPGHQRAAAGPETTHSSGLFLGSGGCRTRLPQGLNSVVWEVP